MNSSFLTLIQSNFDKKSKEDVQAIIEQIEDTCGEQSEKILSLATGVSEILLHINTDFPCILASFWYACLFYEQEGRIPQLLLSNTQVASLIKGLEKIDTITIKTDVTEEYAGLREMFIALAKDMRVILLKLAIESYKVSHQEFFDSKKEMEETFRYVNDIYAPLAAMLGISYLKDILEDRTFAYFKPSAYKDLENALKKDQKQRDQQVMLTVGRIKKEVVHDMDATVYGRQKKLASIYKKTQSKQLDLSKILDLLAVRVIVSTVEECYMVLGRIHGMYVPIDHFKDYISNPKENGYQSLHTTVIVENGDPLEIQIRTQDMHLYAEYGIAAHWAYKQKRAASTESDKKINYIRSIMNMHKKKSDEELMEALKMDIYSGDVFVQTPQGKVIKLPDGSTPIDFAYAIHIGVGDHCMGAKINGKMAPLSTALQNGDMVEIILNPNSKGPSRDWLKIVKTSRARHRIRLFFKKEMKEENIKKGKSILEANAKARNILLSTYMKEEYLTPLFERYAVANLDELYAAIGSATLTSTQVIGKLLNLASGAEGKEESKKQFNQKQTQQTKDQIAVHGFGGILTKFAQCCTPVPGDDIVGYISRGKGVTIHRVGCVTLKSYEKERLIPCSWNNQSADQSFVASIIIYCMNVAGVLSEVTKKISDLKINIVSLFTKTQDETSAIYCSVQIKTKEDLAYLIGKLKALDYVTEVTRT